MNSILIIVVLFFLLFSIFMVYKEGVRGLNLIFFTISGGAIWSMIECFMEGKMDSIRIWIIHIIIIIFSAAMFFLLRKIPVKDNIKKSRSISNYKKRNNA